MCAIRTCRLQVVVETCLHNLIALIDKKHIRTKKKMIISTYRPVKLIYVVAFFCVQNFMMSLQVLYLKSSSLSLPIQVSSKRLFRCCVFGDVIHSSTDVNKIDKLFVKSKNYVDQSESRSLCPNCILIFGWRFNEIYVSNHENVFALRCSLSRFLESLIGFYLNCSSSLAI